MKNINLETNDFKEIIESDSLFIDKTLFIKELIDNPSPVICFPRPSKFGKSLNMSMLNYYFNIEYKNNTLFNGLEIMKQGDKYFKEMNKYPVVSLSLKDTKKITFKGFLNNYKTIMANLYLKYENILMNSKVLTNTEKQRIKTIIEEKEDNPERLPNFLSYLVNYLSRYYGLQVIVLLDDYDVPIINGYFNGYYDEVVDFINQLLVTTFKGNRNLKKGIITCISKICTENFYSCANNIEVYNITDARYSTYFGFTESEVKGLLKEYNLSDIFDDVKKWYGGYLFDENTIYNPWSILKYLENKDHELIPYWTNKEGVGLLKDLIYNIKYNTNLLDEFERIINKCYKEHVNIELNLNLKSLKGDPNTVWTLFMLMGYLTPTTLVGDGENITLKIPNLEIKENLIDMASSWFKNNYNGNSIVKYLANSEINEFKNKLENLVLETFSYLDVPGTSASEAFYHAFVMGLIRIDNEYYEVTSNRESGFGRYDILLKPKIKDIPAYIIEFKLVRDNTTFEDTVETAFNQIETMKYDASVKNLDVIKMAIAFKGKKVKIETR